MTVMHFLVKRTPSSINTRINLTNYSERLGFKLLGETNSLDL